MHATMFEIILKNETFLDEFQTLCKDRLSGKSAKVLN